MMILFTLVNQPSFSNGYDYFSEAYLNGLDPVIADLALAAGGGSVSVADLNNAIINYLGPLYYPGTVPLDQTQQLQSVVGNIFNAYIGPDNPIGSYYTGKQLMMIEQIKTGISNLDVNQFSAIHFFKDVI